MSESGLKNREFLEEKVAQLLQEIARQKQEIAWLKKQVFGPKKEKVDPHQLNLDFLPEVETPPPFVDEAPDDETPPAKKKKSRRNGRAPLPEDLPRQRVEHHPEPEELICSCCHAEKTRIGEEVTEELDYVPASMFVTEHVRVKYACRKCEEGVVLGDLPPQPIVRGLPGPGLLAHIITSKYGDHLPLARQEGILARHGVSIARSTMCDWIRDMAGLLSPIVAEMRRRILSTGYVLTDDTPIRVRTGLKQTKRGAIWCYLSPRQAGEVVYDFTLTRARDGPERFLEGFSGYLQADAYSGYDRIVSSSEVTEVGCWAHARRKFYESLDTAPDEASTVMAGIQRLYAVEADARERELDADGIVRLRRRRSVPILKAIREYIEAVGEMALPKSPIGKAITYALNQWEALCCYVEDGRLSADNNAAERALRKVAVGRKNWLWAGSPAGGERAATLYSLVESCRMQGIDPFTYLRSVINLISTHPSSRIAELTPRGWADKIRAIGD